MKTNFNKKHRYLLVLLLISVSCGHALAEGSSSSNGGQGTLFPNSPAQDAAAVINAMAALNTSWALQIDAMGRETVEQADANIRNVYAANYATITSELQSTVQSIEATRKQAAFRIASLSSDLNLLSRLANGIVYNDIKNAFLRFQRELVGFQNTLAMKVEKVPGSDFYYLDGLGQKVTNDEDFPGGDLRALLRFMLDRDDVLSVDPFSIATASLGNFLDSVTILVNNTQNGILANFIAYRDEEIKNFNFNLPSYMAAQAAAVGGTNPAPSGGTVLGMPE